MNRFNFNCEKKKILLLFLRLKLLIQLQKIYNFDSLINNLKIKTFICKLNIINNNHDKF